MSLLRLHNRAWLCRTNAPGPSPTVGAALAVVRKPSPLKGEGGWPKARRMRVLSRKVALRARESPPNIPLPLKSPLVKRGAQSGVGIPFPRDHSRRALFSLYGRHTGAPGNGPMGASGPTADRMHLRICRRGAQCAPAGRRGRRPLRQNRKLPLNFVGAAHLGRPPFPCAGRRNSYRPASAPSLIPSTNPRRKDRRSLSSPASS